MMCFSDSVGYTQRHGWLKSRGVASLHGVETQTPINQGQVLHDLSCTIDALHDDVRPPTTGWAVFRFYIFSNKSRLSSL